MELIIFDTGKQYVIEVDPNNLPDWILRALHLDNTGISNYT